MRRGWTALLFLVGVVASSPAVAQRCNLDRIRAQFETSESFPSLVGCRPDDVRPILENQDYGLRIENRVASETIRTGRIASQRRGDGFVYVDVSTGPPPREREERNDQFGQAVGQIVGSVIDGAINSPRDRPPRPGPFQPEPQAPDPALVSVLTTPVVAPPVVAPPVVQPPPIAQQPPPPVAQPPPPAREAPRPPPPPPPARADTQRFAQAAPAMPPPRPPAELVPPPEEGIPPPREEIPTEIAPSDPPPPPPRAATRFLISGSPSTAEGEELVLTIRREGSDGANHRLVLEYSDKTFLVSPPDTFEFLADMADVVPLRLRTARAAGDGDRQLTVTLRAEEAEPVSIMAVILDRTSWWEKLLQALAPVPVWAAALGGAAAVAASAAVMMPRASCSIGKGSVSLGRAPLKSRWPDVDVETIIGGAEFSLALRPPLGRGNNAEPNPA
jgi:hypothetical protein